MVHRFDKKSVYIMVGLQEHIGFKWSDISLIVP